MSADMQQVRRKIFDELTKIVDPEINVSIMELQLIDNVDIDGGNVKVDLHLTSPFCPAVFGFKIAQDVKDNLETIEEINKTLVNVSNHFMAEAINNQVNGGRKSAESNVIEVRREHPPLAPAFQ
jgi:metal-sulfur cluster biosynthetic enzyme